MRTAKFVWLLLVALCLVSLVCGQEQQQTQEETQEETQQQTQEETQEEQEKGQLELKEEEEEEPSTYVVDLTRYTKQELEEFINMFKYAIIEFYAPWCGHCKELAPEYEKAATQLARENNPLVFAKVDCTMNQELCDVVQVQGFPTVKLFFHQRMHEYVGPRRAAGIVSYMKKIMFGLTAIADTAETLATYTQNPPALVGFFDSIDSQESLAFERASLVEEAVEFTFVHVVNASLVEELGQKVNAVVLYRQGGGEATYSGEFDGNEIARFAAGHAHPYFMNAARSWDRLVVERKVKHLVLVAADVANAEEWQPLRQVFTKLAEEYAVKNVGFVYVNKQQYSFAQKFGHSGEFYPAVLVMHPEDESVFIVPQEMEITEDSMRDYIEGVRNGSIKGEAKSAEEPENNDGPVKVVVGKTFDGLVINNDQDVLVKFYAPWCGHCKDLIPIYEEVASRFASKEQVVIAEFDSTENDQAHVTVKGFPTIYLFPANHKDEPIKFEGDRTAEAFEDFLYQHATNLAGMVRPQRGEEASPAHPTPQDEL